MPNSSWEVEQVGKRWFIVRRVLNINGNKYEAWKLEASYEIGYWGRQRKWTLTGKGSRSYRDGIIKALEDYLKDGVTHE